MPPNQGKTIEVLDGFGGPNFETNKSPTPVAKHDSLSPGSFADAEWCRSAGSPAGYIGGSGIQKKYQEGSTFHQALPQS